MATTYFYVKDDGTATGDGGLTTTQRTGTWNSTTSEYYATLYDCISLPTTAPVDGDIIIVSDAHAASYAPAAAVQLNLNGAYDGAGLLVVSVDNANQENYKPGASETLITNNNDFALYHTVCIAGISCSTIDDGLYLTGSGTICHLQDLTVSVSTGAGDLAIRFGASGQTAVWTNVDVDFSGASSQVAFFASGGHFTWRGGAITGQTSNVLFSPYGSGGGATFIAEGVDLSLFSGNILPTQIAGTSDTTRCILRNCKLHASVTLYAALPTIQQRFEMYNCDDTTGDTFHRFHVADGAGTASNNDATYVTATESWYEGSDKSSIAVTTTALCNKIQPFVFELPAQYVDLGDTGTDTISIDLLIDNTAFTLTDTDIAAFLVYPDSASMITPNWLTSGKTVGTGNLGIDPLAAGTTLTNTGGLSDSSWTKVLSDANATQYRLELDTSSNVGEATAVGIRIEVYVPSIAAGELFIHPLLTLS